MKMCLLTKMQLACLLLDDSFSWHLHLHFHALDNHTQGCCIGIQGTHGIIQESHSCHRGPIIHGSPGWALGKSTDPTDQNYPMHWNWPMPWFLLVRHMVTKRWYSPKTPDSLLPSLKILQWFSLSSERRGRVGRPSFQWVTFRALVVSLHLSPVFPHSPKLNPVLIPVMFSPRIYFHSIICNKYLIERLRATH